MSDVPKTLTSQDHVVNSWASEVHPFQPSQFIDYEIKPKRVCDLPKVMKKAGVRATSALSLFSLLLLLFKK